MSLVHESGNIDILTMGSFSTAGTLKAASWGVRKAMAEMAVGLRKK